MSADVKQKAQDMDLGVLHLEAGLKFFLDTVGFNFETSKQDTDNFSENEEATSSSSDKQGKGEVHRKRNLTSISSVALLLERVSLFLKLFLRRIRLQKEKKNQENYVNERLVEAAVHHAEILKMRLMGLPYAFHAYQQLVPVIGDEILHLLGSGLPWAFHGNQQFCRAIGDEIFRLPWSHRLLHQFVMILEGMSSEIKRASFEILQEDRDRLERETVRVCSCLGLQIHFLDRLQDMPEKLRHHRTLCDWIVIFLRNNFTALSDSSEENSLSKELLHNIGFDPLSSAVDVIVKRAGSDAQHIDSCDWAEIFVQDEFKYNPLLNFDDNQLVRSKFPFQSAKMKEWFEPLFSERKMTEDSHVIVVNLSSWISASEIPRGREEQSVDLYHGTDHESAVDILNGRGIHLPAGRQKRDFSSGKGFYLTKTLDDAFRWAKRKTVKPAILVFRLKHEFWNSENVRRLDLLSHENSQKWAEIVALFRSGKQSAETREISRNYDLIEGSVAEVSNANGHLEYKAIPLSYQMCLISRDLAKKFQKSLHSILFYQHNGIQERHQARTSKGSQQVF